MKVSKGVLISLLIVGAILPLMAQDELEMEVVDQFNFSHLSRNMGLCYDGTYLWLVDWYSDSLCVINPDNGNVEYGIYCSETTNLHYIAFDGEYLWGLQLQHLYKISPEDGSVLTSFQTPGSTGSTGYIRGITWHNGYLYCLLPEESNITIAALDVENNVWVDTLATVECSFASGLTYLNGKFWFQDFEENTIRSVDAVTGAIGDWFPHYYFCNSNIGITTVGGYMYCTDGFHNIYKYEIEGCTPTQENSIQPESSCLMRSYPNPFNPVTRIEFELAEGSKVKLGVYNLKGRLVEQLFDGRMSKGKQFVNWDGGNRSSGIYFCRLVLDGRVVSTQRMLLLK